MLGMDVPSDRDRLTEPSGESTRMHTYTAAHINLPRSISALQWLLNADTNTSSPIARLSRFFTMLHATLSHGARAALQFYPENDKQVELCMKAATKSGFGGGLVVDYPNSRKARKCFLVLWVGGNMRVPAGLLSDEQLARAEAEEAGGKQLPSGKLAEHESHDSVGQVKFEGRTTARKGKKAMKKARAAEKGSKGWILHKKELYRKRGKEDVPSDSKYTARKSRDVF